MGAKVKPASRRAPGTGRRESARPGTWLGRTLLALVTAFVMALQPMVADAAILRTDDGPLGRLAALIGPLCSVAASQSGRPADGMPAKTGGHDRAGCCLPGCPMLGGALPVADLAAPVPSRFAPPVRDMRPTDATTSDERRWAPARARAPPLPA